MNKRILKPQYHELSRKYEDLLHIDNKIFHLKNGESEFIAEYIYKIQEKYKWDINAIYDLISIAIESNMQSIKEYWKLFLILNDHYKTEISTRKFQPTLLKLYDKQYSNSITYDDSRSIEEILNVYKQDTILYCVFHDNIEQFPKFFRRLGGVLDVDTYFDNNSLIYWCCWHGSYKCFQFLMNLQAKIDESCLEASFHGNNNQIIDELLKHFTPTMDSIRETIKNHSFDYMLFLHRKYRKRINGYGIFRYQNLHALFFNGLSEDVYIEYIDIFGIPSLIDDLIEKGLFNETVGKYILKDAVSSNRFEIIKKLESLGIENDIENEIENDIEDEIETQNIHTTNEPLIFTAIQNNSLDFVKTYINSGASLEITDKHCRTPLFLAVLENRVEITQELIYNGVDVNCKDDSYTRLIELAVKKNDLNLVSLLLSAGAKVDPDDLHYALENNYIEITEIMIQNGVDINGKISSGETALTHAIRINNMTLFNALIRMKVDPNVPDSYGTFPKTPIIMAVQRNSKEMVQALIQSGANIETSPYGGYTPLICAADNGYDEILSILIEEGADLEAVDNRGNTALTTAIRSHQIGCTYILIKAGANLEARSKIGFTLLMHAVEYINENSHETENIINEIISYLISAGANIHAKCRGVTAFMVAAMSGNQGACYLLMEAGANI